MGQEEREKRESCRADRWGGRRGRGRERDREKGRVLEDGFRKMCVLSDFGSLKQRHLWRLILEFLSLIAPTDPKGIPVH